MLVRSRINVFITLSVCELGKSDGEGILCLVRAEFLIDCKDFQKILF